MPEDIAIKEGSSLTDSQPESPLLENPIPNDLVPHEENDPVSDKPLPENTSPKTASQLVFSTRTLVADIIRWFVIMSNSPSHGKDKEVNDDQDTKSLPHRTTLCDLVTINKLWFDQTIPYIWKFPTTKSCSIHQRFAKVNEKRIQTYANFVERCYLIAVSSPEDQIDKSRILHNVTFPRLNHIDLVLRYRERLLCFPSLNAPGLKSVRIRIAWVVKSRTSEKIYFRFGHRRLPRLTGFLGHKLVGYFQVCHRVLDDEFVV